MYACMKRARRARGGITALGILLACCSCAHALDPALDISQYAHTAWKIREGFSKGRVTAIAQTPDGYLWLGTEFGLLRFDGVRNVLWDQTSGEHLPSRYIRNLLTAHDGRLWIGTYKGLASWKDGKLTEYRELAGQTVDALLEDREGTVWAGGYVGSIGMLCAIQSGRPQC
jgi:ligand-binding sensor domain-containing protein